MPSALMPEPGPAAAAPLWGEPLAPAAQDSRGSAARPPRELFKPCSAAKPRPSRRCRSSAARSASPLRRAASSARGLRRAAPAFRAPRSRSWQGEQSACNLPKPERGADGRLPGLPSLSKREGERGGGPGCSCSGSKEEGGRGSSRPASVASASRDGCLESVCK